MILSKTRRTAYFLHLANFSSQKALKTRAMKGWDKMEIGQADSWMTKITMAMTTMKKKVTRVTRKGSKKSNKRSDGSYL